MFIVICGLNEIIFMKENKNNKKTEKPADVPQKSAVAFREEAILKFWEDNKIFEKSLEIREDSPAYSFYDGPPFATGTPHYGHLVGSAMKDIVPRYWTMRGYCVERKWGWDCHGLPIENIAEKELGITHKKEIAEMGVEKFNEFCRSKVLKYVEEWKKVIKRMGRWADMENSYKTMDLGYMESVWWVFKELWDKGYIYEGHRVIHVCTRCETTLSQTEVAEGYKTVKDLAVIAKFPITDEEFIYKFCKNKPTSFVAWTTTPWSLPTTMALAIGADYNYVVVRIKGEPSSAPSSHKATNGQSKASEDTQIICVKERLEYVMSHKPEVKYEIVSEFKGIKMDQVSYEHPFGKFYLEHPSVKNNPNVYKTHITDYVSTEDGTGIVTINGAFGDIDMEAAKKLDLPVVVNVRMDGTFTEEMGEFAGMSVKPLENREKTDVEIIKYLAHNNFLFAKEKYEHSYPHCWRCDTPLINYATSSWYVSVLKIKARALELAKQINWSPEHIKEGRFGKWLEGARDWSISRQRFWASVIPIWRCEGESKVESQKSKVECKNTKVFGSVKDLEEASDVKVADLHKHIVDKIVFKCDKCSGEMHRVPDVLDTWFDSGSMPYAQMHYPFENKEKFDKSFPADFIAEGADQTRAWFYYLHIIASSIKDSKAFKNVIVNGIVLAEDGKKMSKRLQNYPDPMLMFDKYGADALRFYLASSPVMAADTINFKESDVKELAQGMFRMIWNSYLFYKTYAGNKNYGIKVKHNKPNLLDEWIISELNILIEQVNESMEHYEINRAAKVFPKFVDNFSNWYIRRSRDRFLGPEGDADRLSAEQTTLEVLETLCRLIAPFAPYMAEEIYKDLSGKESVHLADYPKVNKKLINEKLSGEMELVRQNVASGLAIRAKEKLKVRQPIAEIVTFNMQPVLQNLIKDELNVKKIITFDPKSAPVFIEKNGHYIIVDSIKSDAKNTEKVITFDPKSAPVFIEKSGHYEILPDWILESDGKITIAFNKKITAELKDEGFARDIARHIQTMRKELGLTKDNAIEIYYDSNEVLNNLIEKWGDYIKVKTIAGNISQRIEGEAYDMEKELTVEEKKFGFAVRKII